jgi:hypothetical protein
VALLLAVGILFEIASDWSIASRMAGDLHWFRQVVEQSRTTRGALDLPPPPGPSVAFLAWPPIARPFTIGAEVVLLTWEHRSAKAALALGYPADVSPGWGVAAWFVPLI